ncbi:MAG: HAMP domain-containing histidine kinase [Deltaproteobacteria bacterium]|nr:HAMP domain-containing histidine kinase [Deltaproteobacteria bacterium]
MRFGKLYVKIFLSFILVMIVSEILIYILFQHSERRMIAYRMEKNTVVKVGLLKDLIDEKAKWVNGMSPLENQEIEDLMIRMGRIYDAEIWISREGESPLMKSFEGELPDEFSLLHSEKASVFGEIRIYHNISRNHRVYASSPLMAYNLKGLDLNIIFNEGFQPQQKANFALGLVIIGAVVALLIIPVSRVVTERVKEIRESALRIADGELSQRVTIKTGDELGELGLAFNQMAERLERMIKGGKELTANVSHELRTPLTRIRIAEELLREQLERGEYKGFKRHMDSIREDIDELDVLIGRILELSKLDIHEPTPSNERLNISALLNELLERVEPVSASKRLQVKTELLPKITLSGDMESLYTAFLNILDNSVKFSPENGEITIRMAGDVDTLTVTITNTFEKLPEGDLERIFEPFYRSKTSNASGSGLGLSIAAKIIQKHGGHITAQNSPGGLEIIVRLPMEKA